MQGRFVSLLVLAALGCAAQPAFAQTAAAPSTKIAPPKTVAPSVVEEPRDVVAAIYDRERAELKKRASGTVFTNPALRAKYFSKSFDLLITAVETKSAHENEPGPLDFDPVIAGQDGDVTKLVLKTELIETGKAVVSASFLNFKQPTVVTYEFVKEDGSWRVSDIKGTTEKEAWSVRKILKGSGREPENLPGMKDAAEKPDATKTSPKTSSEIKGSR